MNYLYDRYKRDSGFYNEHNMYNKNIFISEVPVNKENGRMELYVFEDRGQEPVEDALITIYARTGATTSVPVKSFKTTREPIFIELPVAHPQGQLIKGPEYYFTTYNMTIESKEYFRVTVYNIRLFPNITSKFDYNLNTTATDVPNQEEIIYIPPHLRDRINGQNYYGNNKL